MNKKTPYKILAAFVVLLVVLFTIAFTALMFVNSGVVGAVENGGTYALGTTVTLRNADVRPLSGSVTLKGFKIANPTGYTQPTFFYIERAHTRVALATLREPVIEIPELTLEKITLVVEKKDGKANYQALLDHLATVTAKLPSGGSTPAPASSPADEKKIIINDLRITEVNIEAQLADAPGPMGEIVKGISTIKVPTIKEIRLQNVGKTGTGLGGSGVTLSDLTGIIVRAVMGAASDAGAGILPADLLGDMQGNLAKLGNLSELGIGVVGGVGGAAKAATEQAAKAAQGAVDGAAKEGQKALDNVTKGLGGLIPGGKKEEPKKP